MNTSVRLQSYLVVITLLVNLFPAQQVFASQTYALQTRWSAGYAHVVSVTADGVVESWGDNTFGQQIVPSMVLPVLRVAAGWYHSMAVLSDGSLVCWGNNESGQCAIPDDAREVSDVAGGYLHTAAILADGSLLAWGDTTHNQTAVPSTTSAIALAAGYGHTLALQSNGNVLAWGHNRYNQATVPGGLSDVVAVAAGDFHSLALTGSGAIVAWGDNSYGQTNVPEGLPPVVAIAAGGNHSLALLNTGAVVAWGAAHAGQIAVPNPLWGVVDIVAGQRFSMARLGNGRVVSWGVAPRRPAPVEFVTTEPTQTLTPSQTPTASVTATRTPANTLTASPTPIPTRTAIHTHTPTVPSLTPTVTHTPVVPTSQLNKIVGGGTDTVYGIDREGRAWAWSVMANNNRQLLSTRTDAIAIDVHKRPDSWADHWVILFSDGSVQTSYQGQSVFLDDRPVKAVAIGTRQLLAVFFDGTVYNNPLRSGRLWNCRASRECAQISTIAGTNVVSVAAGEGASYALKANGQVVAWGNNVRIPLAARSDVTSIKADMNGGMVLKRNRTVVEWGSPWPKSMPEALSRTRTANAVAITYGRHMAGALLSNGNVVFWGAERFTMPAFNMARNRVDLAAGWSQALLRTEDGSIFAWNSTTKSSFVPPSMGTPTLTPTITPTALSLLVRNQLHQRQPVAVAPNFVIGINRTNQLKVWGLYEAPNAALVTGANNYRKTPVAVAASNQHVVVLSTDGTVQSWGSNLSGETRVPVGLTDVISVAAGARFSLALKSDGTIVSWGDAPTVPVSAVDVVRVKVANLQVIALTANGAVVVWGDVSETVCGVRETLTDVVDVAVNSDTYFAVQADGSVVTWGCNSEMIISQPTLNNVVSLAVSDMQVVALGTDRSLTFWPMQPLDSIRVLGATHVATNGEVTIIHDDSGRWYVYEGTRLAGQKLLIDANQLLPTQTIPAVTRTPTPSDNFVVPMQRRPIAASSHGSSFFIDADNNVLPYGNTSVYGYLTGSAYYLPSTLKKAVAINTFIVGAMKLEVGMALLPNGRVMRWDGWRAHNMADVRNVVAFDSNGFMMILLHRDGHVSTYGQSSPYSSTRYTYLVPAGVDRIKKVALTQDHFAAIREDGALLVWDNKFYEHNRMGSLVHLSSAVSTNVCDIASGVFHFTVLHCNNTVSVISLTHSHFAQAVPSEIQGEVIAVTGDQDHSHALLRNGRVVTWGRRAGPSENWRDSWNRQMNPQSGVVHIHPLQEGYVAQFANGRLLRVSRANVNSIQNRIDPKWRMVALTATPTMTPTVTQTFTPRPTQIPTATPQPPVRAFVPQGQRLAAGFAHSLAIRSNGTVVGWGDNRDGALAIPSNLNRVVSVAAGSGFSFALRDNGSVVGWGLNTTRSLRVPASATNVIAIAAGLEHMVALRRDGTVVSWGSNAQGQTRVPVGLRDFVAIAAGAYHTMALRADGTVVSWGDDAIRVGEVPSDLNNVVAIAAGSGFSVALQSDGTVRSWGVYKDSDIPDLPKVVRIAAGGNMALALTTNGTMVRWGARRGVDIPNVVEFTVGHRHALAYRGDNRWWRFGSNSNGQIEIPDGINVIPAVPTVPLLTVKERRVQAGAAVSVVRRLDGSLLIWGENPTNQVWADVRSWRNQRWFDADEPQQKIFGITSANTVSVKFASNTTTRPIQQEVAGLRNLVELHSTVAGYIALRSNGTVFYNHEHPAMKTKRQQDICLATDVDMSENVFVVVCRDGTIDTWGRLTQTTGYQSPPDRLFGVVEVSAGDNHVVAVRNDGSVAAWGMPWSFDTNAIARKTNVVSAEAETNYTLFVHRDGSVSGQCQVAMWKMCILPPETRDIIELSASRSHAIALRNDGHVVLWGDRNGIEDNSSYLNQRPVTALPSLTRTVTLTPTLPTIIKKRLGAGGYHTLLLDLQGDLHVWGHNNRGQSDIPEGLTNVQAVAGGESHSLALLGDGSVVTWGAKRINSMIIPAVVPENLPRALAIDAGSAHSVAMLPNGTVRVWGDNEFGQLNVPTGLRNVVAIAAGSWHTVALRKDGTVVSWGDNGTRDKAVPRELTSTQYFKTSGDRVVKIAAGTYVTLALRANGKLEAWGNSRTQIHVAPVTTGIVDIAVAGFHAYARQSDGTWVCWSDYPDSPFGMCDAVAGLDDVVLVSGGLYHAVALRRDGELRITGTQIFYNQHVYPTAMTLMPTPTITPTPSNTATATPTDPPTLTRTPTMTGTPIPRRIEVAAARHMAVAVLPNGSVVSWGAMQSVINAVKSVTQGKQIIASAISDESMVFLQANGRIFTLDYGNRVIFSSTTGINALVGVVDIAIEPSSHYVVVLHNTGFVSSFVGRGTSSGSALIPPNTITTAKAIAAGYNFGVAVLADGSVVDWGFNPNRGNIPSDLPAMCAVAAGYDHTVALSCEGRVYAWSGSNSLGQATVPVAAQSDVVAIHAHTNASYAIKSSGEVIVWGSGLTPPSSLRIVSMTSDNWSALGVRENGSVVCWGDCRNPIPAGLRVLPSATITRTSTRTSTPTRTFTPTATWPNVIGPPETFTPSVTYTPDPDVENASPTLTTTPDPNECPLCGPFGSVQLTPTATTSGPLMPTVTVLQNSISPSPLTVAP